MTPLRKRLSVLLYQDVLCAWSYLADLRLAPLREELRQVVHFRTRPFPLRPGVDYASASFPILAAASADLAAQALEHIQLR